MIGGVVIEVKILPDKIWINTVEKREGCNDKCAIYVESNEQSRKIKPGDSLWWQSGFAMWTPHENVGKPRGKYDIRIPRIGFSGVAKP